MHQNAKLAAIVLTLLLTVRGRCGTNTFSIGLNFGADEPAGAASGALLPTDAAGVPSVAQANWNNLTNAAGSAGDTPATTIFANSNGTAVATSVHVEWSSSATSSANGGDEVNGASFLTNTPNQKLIVGYLDQNANNLTSAVVVSNIPTTLTTSPGGYNIYVSAIDGIAGRGGGYRVFDNTPPGTNVIAPYKRYVSDLSPTGYVQDPGTVQTNASGAIVMSGNYLVFRGLTNRNIRIVGENGAFPISGTPRTPINAIQLVPARTPGEPSPATSLIVNTSLGSGNLGLSWTTNAGTTGSLVVMRQGRVVTAEPVDGVVYSGDANFGTGDNLGDDNIGAGNFVVYAGPGTNVTVTHVAGFITNSVAVYAYSGTGAPGDIDYTLDSPLTGNLVAPAQLQGISLQLPATLQTNGVAQGVAIATFDAGSPLDVTTWATYSSSNTAAFTVDAAGVVTGVGSIIGIDTAISAVFHGATNTATISTVEPPTPVLMNRYRFNIEGDVRATDSNGGKHGTLIGGAVVSGGQLLLDGTAGTYVQLPNDLVSSYDAITVEMWITDLGTFNWGRIFDFGNNTAHYLFLSPNNNTNAVPDGDMRFAAAIDATEQGVTWAAATGSRPQLGRKTHVVVTTDAQTRRGVLYVDGVAVAVNAGMTISPKAIGPASHNSLGRSQFAADGWFKGRYDEFRIWLNAMTPLQVAVDAAAGPNSVVADPGALQSIGLRANTNMFPGTFQSAGVSGNFANISGVNILALGPTFTSGDTNVLTVDATGVITARAVGATTVQASFGGQTDIVAFSVVTAPTPTLAHRYSFDADATDSVGGADGTLSGSAVVTNGQVVLDGAGSVVLPPGLISNSSAVTIETWVNLGDQPAAPVYVFSLGDTTPAGTAANYVRLSPQSALDGGNTLLTINGPVLTSGQLVGGIAENLTYGSVLYGPLHLVAVVDPPSGAMRLYVNGRLFQTNSIAVPLSTFNNLNNYLGQSLAATESGHLVGSIDEFRVYNGALTLGQIRTSLAAGPTNWVIDAGTLTSLALSAAPVMILQSRQLPTVTGSSATVSNINLTQVPGVTLSSSDPNIIAVLADGRIVGNRVGVAKLTAAFGSVASSKVVRVVPKQVALLHRYSFDTGSDGFGDSVAGADAVRWGHAATNGFGAVFLDGTRSTWVELPPYLVDALQTFTVEAWVTTLPTSPDNTGTRLFDFGDFTAAALPAGNTRAYFSPAAGSAGDQTRIAFQTQTPLPAGENGFSTAAGTSLDGTGPHHVAAIFQADPAQPVYEAVFVDGTMTISNGGAAAITRNLTNVNNAFSFIGRSLSAGDNYLTGLIDEFRLYAGALTKAQVQADFTAGPDGAPVVGAMTPILDGSIVGSNFVVTWPDTPSGFALISSTNVISWTPVLGVPPPSNGLFTFIVPISGAGFYRLQK